MVNTTTSLIVNKRLYCNRCRGETNHIQRGIHSISEGPDEDGNRGETTHVLWTCAGCEAGMMETELRYIVGDEEPVCSSSYDPPRSRDDLRAKVFRKIPPKLRTIYAQTVKAFNHKLWVLCAAGLRALIEGICADKGLNGRNLEQKINALEGYLPRAIVANLHSFRFMGNQAVHELTAPKPDELKIAINVIEDLLNFLYDLDYKASLLARKVAAARGGA